MTVSASKGDQNVDNRLNYELYDEYGNILQLSQQDGTSICYIWGYNNTMPIAKIENGKYNLIDANLIEHAKLASNSNDGASELIIRLQNIRNALPNAMVTTYTYIPLVGLATVTDPRGYTTTYDYDSFGRLAKVFDAAGNQLSTNEYHFRTQN
jgi:YD repeat-containing protein